MGILLAVFLWACGQGGSDSTPQLSSEIRFKVPFTHIAGLTATLEISGVGIFPMTVTDGTASATVPGIPAGLHTFTVTYYRGACNGDPTILARASTSAEIVAGQNTLVQFVAGEMDRNFDDDLDGWANLAEIQQESDPCLATSFPLGDDPRRTILSAGGAIQSTPTTIHDSVGEPVEGRSSISSSYTVRGGFAAYP